ncbi:MAG TPA: hypothetical protein VF275_13265 [Gammaproteobacteria bacterium]
MILGELDSALSLWDRISGWWERGRQIDPLSETIPSRFVRLFESHGVHRNQIPRFFGHGLSIANMQTDEALLPKLTEEVLDAACTKFAVRRVWLDGADNQVHPTHDFYKCPEQFAAFIDALRSENPDVQIIGRVLSPKERDWDAQALIVLEEPIGWIGNKLINRFHLCDDWTFSYWKARAYLAACVALAWDRNIYIHGVTLPVEQIKKYDEGRTLLGWGGKGVDSLHGHRWHPEDMALKPKVFLNGIDPERDNFGLKSGLKLWLELEAQGLMEMDLPYDNVRAKFMAELEKYQ